MRAWPALLLLACACASDPPPPAARSGPCGDGAKVCGGECVGIADPLYGCGVDTCEPCAGRKTTLLVCQAGACALALCRSTWADCNGDLADGCETDLLDPRSCGGCSVVCEEGASCSKRGCGACEAKETSCDRRCVDVDTDPDHCGGCGNACPRGPGAVARCKDATCSVRCDDGFADCDGDPTNGCEPLQPYFRDEDGDGFGAGARIGRACVAPPGYALRGGDCFDRDARVHPGAAEYRTEGYGDAASFDYDCDGSESEVPGSALGACATGTCLPGYVPRLARGPGTNAFCGSTLGYTCGAGGAATCATTPASALGCR